jgi:DNA-binding GntR family transcriptional regulator
MPKLEIKSKKAAVYDWLHSAILRGEIPPGEDLVIDELAGRLGVSPIPVREALQQLQVEGFVVIKPYAGVTVTELRPEVLFEVFLMLETAEVVSGRMACAKICDEELDAIRDLLLEMDSYLDDPEQWSEANVRYHRLISSCSETTLVESMMENLLNHWDRLRRYYLKDVFSHRIGEAQAEHWKMYEALREKDADRFEEITRSHNRSALKSYIEYLRNQGVETVNIPVQAG